MDFIKNISGLIKERISTPLWANFIFVWLVYNWHVVILILYSNDGSPLDLISKIKQHNFFIRMPIVYTLGLTLLLPYLNTIVYVIIEYSKVLRRNARIQLNKFEKIDPVIHYEVQSKLLETTNSLDKTKAEFNAIRDANSKTQNSLSEALKRLNDATGANEKNEHELGQMRFLLSHYQIKEHHVKMLRQIAGVDISNVIDDNTCIIGEKKYYYSFAELENQLYMISFCPVENIEQEMTYTYLINEKNLKTTVHIGAGKVYVLNR